MKKIVLLLVLSVCFWSCKKDDTKNSSTPEPEPVKTGNLNFKIQVYDSLGQVESSLTDVRLFLSPVSQSVMINADGNGTFKDLPYGNYYPVVQSYGYEGLPLSVNLNSGNVAATLPLAKFSMFQLVNLSGQVVSKDSITLSYNLTKSIPAGKSCKIAIITNTSTVNGSDFLSADTLRIYASMVSKQNIARLPGLKKWLSGIKDSALFYLAAVPVTYGTYLSNVTFKTVLLGDNPQSTNNLPLKKNW